MGGGAGWFGATQPGRQDGVGFDLKAGQAVDFTWTKPAEVQAPTSMELYWSKRPPGGAWSGWIATAMTEAGGAWSAQLPAQDHGTELRSVSALTTSSSGRMTSSAISRPSITTATAPPR